AGQRGRGAAGLGGGGVRSVARRVGCARPLVGYAASGRDRRGDGPDDHRRHARSMDLEIVVRLVTYLGRMPGGTSARDCFMHDASQGLPRSFCIGAALAFLVAIPGCGPIATIAWLIHGPEMIPAEFDGLKGKRVAVVCLDANSLSGPGGEADAV